MWNRLYGDVRGRKTKVGRKLLRFPPTRLRELITESRCHLHKIMDTANYGHCRLWFNNNASITSLIRTFVDENASILKVLYLFLGTIQRDTQLICHFLTSYHRARDAMISIKKASSLLKERLFPLHLLVHLWASMPQRTVQMQISPYNLFVPILIMYLAFLMIILL